MALTPSSRRRRGREDFSPGADPASLCPYKDFSYIEDYVDGWRQASREYEAKQSAIKDEENNFNTISTYCPWIESDMCIATNIECRSKNCAVWHFIKKMEE